MSVNCITRHVPFGRNRTLPIYFSSLYEEIIYAFRPEAIVVQCGADSLSLDPLGGFNLTLNGLGQCVSKVLGSDLPTLVLGGGGYNRANAARYRMTSLT